MFTFIQLGSACTDTTDREIGITGHYWCGYK